MYIVHGKTKVNASNFSLIPRPSGSKIMQYAYIIIATSLVTTVSHQSKG